MITKDFLKLVLQDKKKLLTMQELRVINVPCYDELSVKNLYPRLVLKPEVMLHFPDNYPTGRQCDRQYLFNVWNTLFPSEVATCLEHANQLRFSILNQRVKEDSILISEAWVEQLQAMSFSSHKKGKMSNLLKSKTKVAK